MKKSTLFIFIAFLFCISCSNGDDPLVPCITVSDCPDSSYSCLDGYCVHSGAIVDPTDYDDSDFSDTLPDSGKNDGGDTSEETENNDGESDSDPDSELPDPVSNDDDDTPASSDEDGENEDSDGETGPDNDGTAEECAVNEDCLSNPNNIRCDTSTGKCVMCLSSDDCLSAYGQSCDTATHQCVSDKTCAAAVEKLPRGGVFDWEDGTTQGFSTNAYWDLVPSSLLPAEAEPVLTHGGNYSFGQYSGYSELMDYTSALESVADLSACSQCVVKAHFYARGQVENDSSSRDFIHPTCNGVGQFEAKNSKVSTQSFDPASPWEKARFDNGQGFEVKYNSYSTQKWTELDWTIPEACKTDQFVFGLRFTSSFMVNKNGLVVDNLTIAPAATGSLPDGAFESAAGGYIKGWTCDPDAHAKNVLVKVEYYKNKDKTSVAALRWAYAKLQRLGDPELQEKCSETYNHGFEVPFDAELAAVLGEGNHSAAVFAVDIPAAESHCAGTYTELGEKEFVFPDSETGK